jgi:phage shock protein C
VTCVKCQKELEPESAFCRFCGADVRAQGTPKRLTRRPAEGKLGGVCAGIAAYLETDVALVRLGWVILSIVPGLFLGGALAYLAAWLMIPVAEPDGPAPSHGRRLMRSISDKQIAGVCGGIAEYLGLDSTLVRVLAVVLAIYPGALIGGVIVYLVAWFIMPAARLDLQSLSATT